MAVILPTINGGYLTTYPLINSVAFGTKVRKFRALRESRIATNSGLAGATLSYSQITRTDRDLLELFFETVQGTFTPFTFGALTNMQFLNNSISFTETFADQFSATFSMRQQSTQYATAGLVSSGQAFPVFSNGLIQQYPIQRAIRRLGSQSNLPCGATYGYPLSTAAFQMGVIHDWSWPMLLTSADAQLLQSFFVWQRGAYGEFSFVDPLTGTTFQNCRFNSDSLQLQSVGINQVQVTVLLTQTYDVPEFDVNGVLI